jgi:hypothetical protein
VFANSIVPIDPETGTLGMPVPVGSEPYRMALSDDATTLWVGLNGAGAIRRVALPALVPGPLTSLGDDPRGLVAGDLAVQPGTTDVVAVALYPYGPYGRGERVAVFDSEGRRPSAVSGWTDRIEFSNVGALFAVSRHLSPESFYELRVGDDGVALVDEQNGTVVDGDMRFLAGRLYASGGRVLDPSGPSFYGTNSGPDVGVDVAVDAEAGLVYYLGEDAISVHDLERFVQLASLALPGLAGPPGSLVLWRSGRLALHAGDRVYFVDAELSDEDGDGRGDPRDNCRRQANADQHDSDLDRIGDACDLAPAAADTEFAVCTDEWNEWRDRTHACWLQRDLRDDDGDGEDDAHDRCPGTPASEAVDDSGCSLAQFCGLQAEHCTSADWGNDEPRGKSRDCARLGSKKLGYACVPAPTKGKKKGSR